jgi:hypothetical protein
VIAGVCTREERCLSVVLAHIALELAKSNKKVLLVDLAEAGGSLAEMFQASLPTSGVGQRSAKALYTGGTVSFERLQEQSVEVGGTNGRLRLVPGLAPTGCGTGLVDLLPRLKGGLRMVDADYVILDLGACLAQSGLVDPAGLARAIRDVSTSGSVISVVSTDPPAFAHCMQVMRAVGPVLQPEVIVCDTNPEWAGALMARWRGDRSLASAKLRSKVDWDVRGYSRWLRTGRPGLDVSRAVRTDLRLLTP